MEIGMYVSGGDLEVLVIDDSEMVRDLLSEVIDGIDHARVVGGAASADEAFSLIHSLKPDIVTLDIRMPRGSGFSLLQRLRGARVRPDVIVLTNYPFSSYRRRCLALGASAFFDKTTELHKFTDLLRSRMTGGGS